MIFKQLDVLRNEDDTFHCNIFPSLLGSVYDNSNAEFIEYFMIYQYVVKYIDR